MTGLCCRCQVRHDDLLCCTHGIEHRGDVGDTLLGVQRPAEYDCPACGRPRACSTCEHCGDLDGAAGVADVGTIIMSMLVAVILAGCAWLGYHAGDWAKVLAAVALVSLGGFALVWMADRERKSVDDHPASWRGPATFRADHSPRSRGNEPKEQ